jgi:phosphoribosylanthranilate isomerase
MTISVKICGINDAIALTTAVEAGARYVGLVFYPPSPRAVTVELAQQLAALVPPHVTTVGLFVEPKDKDLLAVLQHVPLGMIQLHGDEPPKRVAAVKGMTGLPVMKAVKIASAEDLKTIPAFDAAADQLLFDAKAPPHMDALPGGNALAFDWGLLQGIKTTKPWMLAGGLNAGNLVEAVRITGAKMVDVSSGVEDSPGKKNPDKIRELIKLAQQL